MKNMLRHLNVKVTPQSDPIPGRESDMTKNYAGAYSFKADKWTRLNRFLTIGSEGGTYHASEKQVTLDNISSLAECVAEDGVRVVQEVRAISLAGRAPKNDQAILVLAYCLKKGNLETRRAAATAVNDVNRIGTHIFQFSEALENYGGWGHLTGRAIADWYNARTPEQLAFQIVKYQQRNGVGHADLIRRSHARRNMPDDVSDRELREAIYGWLCPERPVSDKMKEKIGFPKDNWPWTISNAKQIVSDALPIVEGFYKIREARNSKEAAALVRQYRLPREAVPTEFLDSNEVWEALLEQMPMTALIRNLGKMSNIGLLGPMSSWTKQVVDQLANKNRLRKARVHPINVAIALKTYALGHGIKGELTWLVNQQIVNALDDAFYASFDNLQPTNKRILVAIDKSGSMHSSASNTILSGQEAAAIMAMATVKKANQYYVIGYDSDGRYWGSNEKHKGVVELRIDPRMRLNDVIKALPHDGGGTDASLPARWAVDNKIDCDAISLYSDGESWAGHQHASQAIVSYRENRGLDTLFVTCDTVANHTQLVDIQDARSFHVSGFDSNAPQLIQEFINSN